MTLLSGVVGVLATEDLRIVAILFKEGHHQEGISFLEERAEQEMEVLRTYRAKNRHIRKLLAVGMHKRTTEEQDAVEDYEEEVEKRESWAGALHHAANEARRILEGDGATSVSR